MVEGYVYKPYPKWVKTPDGRNVIVQNEEEHKALAPELTPPKAPVQPELPLTPPKAPLKSK